MNENNCPSSQAIVKPDGIHDLSNPGLTLQSRPASYGFTPALNLKMPTLGETIQWIENGQWHLVKSHMDIMFVHFRGVGDLRATQLLFQLISKVHQQIFLEKIEEMNFMQAEHELSWNLSRMCPVQMIQDFRQFLRRVAVDRSTLDQFKRGMFGMNPDQSIATLRPILAKETYSVLAHIPQTTVEQAYFTVYRSASVQQQWPARQTTAMKHEGGHTSCATLDAVPLKKRTEIILQQQQQEQERTVRSFSSEDDHSLGKRRVIDLPPLSIKRRLNTNARRITKQRKCRNVHLQSQKTTGGHCKFVTADRPGLPSNVMPEPGEPSGSSVFSGSNDEQTGNLNMLIDACTMVKGPRHAVQQSQNLYTLPYSSNSSFMKDWEKKTSSSSPELVASMPTNLPCDFSIMHIDQMEDDTLENDDDDDDYEEEGEEEYSAVESDTDSDSNFDNSRSPRRKHKRSSAQVSHKQRTASSLGLSKVDSNGNRENNKDLSTCLDVIKSASRPNSKLTSDGVPSTPALRERIRQMCFENRYSEFTWEHILKTVKGNRAKIWVTVCRFVDAGLLIQSGMGRRNNPFRYTVPEHVEEQNFIRMEDSFCHMDEMAKKVRAMLKKQKRKPRIIQQK